MKERITTKRVIMFFITAILPILSIALGCFLLFADTLFNMAFFITHVAIPTISIAFLAMIIFSKRRVVVKTLLTIFVLFAFIVSFLISSMVGTFEMLTYKSDDEIGQSYTDVCKEFDCMPTLDELGNYTKVEHYDYFSSTFGIFTCDADTLIVYYNSDEYQKQKALLDNKYVFQEAGMTASQYTCMPSTKIGSYSFRTLNIKEYNSEIDYPQKMVFIATNEQDCSISYTAFYDDDIDYIESLENFLLNDCGWKHIVKD